MIKERASLSELREFCNKVREAGGANPLDAILEAIPEEANECLIARNLNFSCKVQGVELEDVEIMDWQSKYDTSDDEPWGMFVDSEKLAHSICEATGCDYVDQSVTKPLFAVILPPMIGNFANNFDETYRELDNAILGHIDESSIDSELIGLIEGLDSSIFDIVVDEIKNGCEDADAINTDIVQLIADNRKEISFNSVMNDIKEAAKYFESQFE